jgi:hypothetical protein
MILDAKTVGPNADERFQSFRGPPAMRAPEEKVARVRPT